MTQYYVKIGQGVLGPLREQEVVEMIKDGALPLDGLVSRVGQQDWRSPKDMPQFAPLLQEPTPAAPSPTAGTAGSPQRPPEEGGGEVEEEVGEEKSSKFQLISNIRKNLEDLANRQVESIVAKVRAQELGEDLVKTKKQQEEIKREIRDSAIEYWRRSGLFRKWIADFVWTDREGKRADRRRKLKGTYSEKYEDACGWLKKIGYYDEAGCYCFIAGDTYLYIGQAGQVTGTEKSIGIRVCVDWKKAIWWEKADSLRVIVPKNKKQCEPLERLLILNYTPQDNETDGNNGNNRADEILDMIDKEIEELASDRE
jgi:hypothetical protein